MTDFQKNILQRIANFNTSFEKVVFAQVKISFINTCFTAVYLAICLPLAGYHLPLTKTLIVFTFLAGLVPVVGNLLSNTFIFIVSFSVSPLVAVASLVYLVAIHKLEYFMNAKIVGTQIQAKAVEILSAMLVMEVVFGMVGLISAPILYAYLKLELKEQGII